MPGALTALRDEPVHRVLRRPSDGVFSECPAEPAVNPCSGDPSERDPAVVPDLPVVAYVLLWFPLSSETFIFREVAELISLGMPIRIYTLYGKRLRGCSSEMRAFPGTVQRMGIRALGPIFYAFFRALGRDPRTVWRLLRQGFFRRMRNLESLGENLWCFLAGFFLAEMCLDQGVKLIHAPWANGPATAAWVASRLTGIPFAFTGRAGDIYPEDGLLHEKSADALFIRTNNHANVEWLRRFCPPGQEHKVHAVYNSLTFKPKGQCAVRMAPPYRLLAVGRFARTKGFPDLMTAMARLKRENVPVSLTLVGDGRWRHKLVRMRQRLGLQQIVSMPGFIPHDQICDFMLNHDLLIMPSVVHVNGDRDGIPNVIMEALSHGMPVIATDVCGIGEVVRNGETGMLIPQRDPRTLADAIRYMLAHRQEALNMARAGRALVQELFDGERNIAELLRLYTEECSRYWRTVSDDSVARSATKGHI
ncbi:MAG: glycosyltransferase [Desulfovibrio sp.]|nr:glycosyltransferase [Desulfovibrio sp.]